MLPKQSRLWLAKQLLNAPCRPLEYARPAELDGIVAFTPVPFNTYLEGKEPDKTNADIADILAEFMERYDVPCIGQWEHTNLLKKRGFNVIQFPGHRQPAGTGERVQTQWLVKWQAEQVEKLARRRSVKVASFGIPEHLGRILILQRYFGLDPRAVEENGRIRYDKRIDRPGVQLWCTSRERFEKYEFPKARVGTAGKAFVTPWEF